MPHPRTLALLSLAAFSILAGGCFNPQPDPPGNTTTETGMGGGNGGTDASGGGGGGTLTGTTSSSSQTTTTATNDGGAGTGGAGGATGGAGGAPGSCTFGDACPPGQYCEAPGCGAGACVPTPIPASVPATQDPVCGCDGVTYWNPETAAVKGMSVAAAGACAAPIACGQGSPCPAGMKCNREAADAASCSPQVAGTCWGVVANCPAGGPQAKACTNQQCELVCSLVQSQNPWFDDGACP